MTEAEIRADERRKVLAEVESMLLDCEDQFIGEPEEGAGFYYAVRKVSDLVPKP